MRKLSNIQILRGIAALMVVVFHAREEAGGLDIQTRLPGFMSLAVGVDIFFVISGLVMVYASASMFGSARQAMPFMLKRLARIVPLYWAVTAIFVLLDPADARGDLGRRAFARFLALSLAFVSYAAPVDSNTMPIYPLGWTLNYEMAFYLCFALAIALPRRGAVAVLTLGFAALVAVNGVLVLPQWLSYLGATQILEFVAGLLIAEAALSGWRLPRRAALPLMALGFAVILATTTSSDLWWNQWRGIVWGLPAAAIVASAALCPPSLTPGRVRRWFERLGDASYALYLVHYGTFLGLESVLGRFFTLSRWPAVPFLLVLVVPTVALSFVVHRNFEVPVTRWLQRRVAPRQAPSLAVAEH